MTVTDFIDRETTEHIYNMSRWFPVVSVTGPRQSGKSTLLRKMFPKHTYINLEDVELRRQALYDPVGFIKDHPERLIIDEAQYAPEIFSMIQVAVDESHMYGQYILSGSQNFLLLDNIQQSLAGRVGIVRLLPLSYKELHNHDEDAKILDMLFMGGYPALYSGDVPKDILMENYIETYVARDISKFLNAVNIGAFRDFLKLCAHLSANLVNLTNISNHIDISRTTCKQWMSYLDSSYIAFQLRPYYTNKIKTLTKTPKLYFYDTGLLTYLLGIKSEEELLTSSYLGQVFENFVVAETVKNYNNTMTRPDLYYYRDDSKLEADLLDLTDRTNVTISEIKSGRTYQDKFLKQLTTITNKLPFNIDAMQVIMRVDMDFRADPGRVVAVKDYLLR